MSIAAVLRVTDNAEVKAYCAEFALTPLGASKEPLCPTPYVTITFDL